VPVRSIRARLTLWYTSLLTVTLLLLGGAAYSLLSYSLSHEVNAALDGVANALIERAESRSATFVPAEIDEAFRRFFGFSLWDHYFQMLDPQGNGDLRQPGPPARKLPLSQQALNNALHGIASFETVTDLGAHPVRVLTMPIMKAGRMINLVQVGMSLQSVLETRLRFLLIMAGILPLGLVLAGSGGWLLAHRALQPVDRMTAAARRISAEHLAERVAETGAGDELDRLAKTLNQMFTRLDASFSQIRQFSADASHELQTPLTILKGELEVALRSPRSPEDYQATLRSALEEVDRIARLVEGLLLLARAEAGVLKMDRQPVDLADLVQEVASRLNGQAESRAVELRLETLEPLVIQGDPERLRRLLLNLVDNAIKYTGPGGRVTLALQRENGWAALRVSDTGIGMATAEQESVFRAFYRSAEVGTLAEKGTGLGLSIARSIALAHGGTIQVDSAPGEGSTFRVLLPLHKGVTLIVTPTEAEIRSNFLP
jgi:heavy metal sensor kinase